MSQFGGLIPPIIRPPSAAVPDLTESNDYAEAARALLAVSRVPATAAAVDEAQTRRQTRQDLLDAEVEQQKLTLETAKVRADENETRRELARAQIEGKQALADYEELADLEQAQHLALIGHMPNDEAMEFVKRFPAADPRNAKKIAEQMGIRLAQSAVSEIMLEAQELATSEGAGAIEGDFFSRRFLEWAQQKGLQDLHPETIHQYWQTGFNQLVGVRRRYEASKVQAQQEELVADARRHRRFLIGNSIENFVEGQENPAQLVAELVKTYEFETGPDKPGSQAEMERELAWSISSELARRMQAKEDPEKLQKWYRQFQGNLLHELKATPIPGSIDRRLEQQQKQDVNNLIHGYNKRIEGIVSDFRREISDVDGSPALLRDTQRRINADPILPKAEKDKLNRKIGVQLNQITAVRDDAAEIADLAAGGVASDRQWSPEAMDRAFNFRMSATEDDLPTVAAEMASTLGTLPRRAKDRVEALFVHPADLQQGMAVLSSVERVQGRDFVTSEIARFDGSAQALASIVYTTSRGKSEERAQQIAGVMGTLEAQQLLIARGMDAVGPVSQDGPAGPAMREYMIDSHYLGDNVLGGRMPTPAEWGEWRDYYNLGFVEAMASGVAQDANAADTAARRYAAAEFSSSRVTLPIRGQGDVTVSRHDWPGLTPAAAREVATALGIHRDRLSRDGMVLPNNAFQTPDGDRVIPVVHAEFDPDEPESMVAGFLVGRSIDSLERIGPGGAQFDALAGHYTGARPLAEIHPNGDIVNTDSISLEEADANARAAGQPLPSDRLLAEAAATWAKKVNGGKEPNFGDPDQWASFMEWLEGYANDNLWAESVNAGS